MMDVAARAGTTVATVSRVVNNVGYVGTSLRERVKAAIADVGYISKANARILRTKRSRTIGLVVGDLMNPYSFELANAVTEAAMDYGYTTLIATAADDQASDLAVIKEFHQQRVDGLVIATIRTERADAALRQLAEDGMPIALIGCQLKRGVADSVSAGFRRGGRLGTQHLIDLGHRRIAFVGAALSEAGRVTQLQGHLDALEEADIRVPPEYIVGSQHPANGSRHSGYWTGYQGVLQLLKLRTPPSAIVARNDYTAFGVLQALAEQGVSVPESMSVVGFGNTPMTAAVTPTLTSVSQPTRDEGRTAVECLRYRIEHRDQDRTPREIVLECTLVPRGSSARLPTAVSGRSIDSLGSGP